MIIELCSQTEVTYPFSLWEIQCLIPVDVIVSDIYKNPRYKMFRKSSGVALDSLNECGLFEKCQHL